MSEPAVRAPSGLRQFRILIRLWWLHMRRRPMRVGEAPKLSGVPTFLLIGALSSGYMTMLTWQSVMQNVKHDPGRFTWHVLGLMSLGFGTGLSKGVGKLQVRGTRNDAFLDALPLRTLARLGLSFADTITLLPLTVVGAPAALSAYRSFAGSGLRAAGLGLLAFVSCYVAGMAAIAWTRALGPATAARAGHYLGVALSIGAALIVFMPLGNVWIGDELAWPAHFARLWLAGDSAVYAAAITLGFVSYRALAAAERYGIDQLDPPIRAPAQHSGARDRLALERVLMWRQGGRALLVMHALIGVFVLSYLALGRATRLPAQVFIFATGFLVYLGALQTIGQAARAARADHEARTFLAALPMSPHQVLEGKARALRLLVSPVLALLFALAVASALHRDPQHTYRIALSLLALFVVVPGAVSIAFLSTGIGVIGVSGAQSSGFSTQVLMLPLLATVMAPNDWSATTALITVAAVTFESRRAARTSVRWIDDPADDLERETTVWRALLAASAFFALQALSFQILSLFELAPGYAFAFAFASSAAMLALLTWRNDARFERPRWLPNRAWYWPLGVSAGVASGFLARQFAKLIAPPIDAPMPELSRGELIAMGIMMTVVAPLVEEYFFRGWLQRAVAADLPAQRKRWAFALGALAFALAHLGTYGVPQLVLGLLAGWLFARSKGLGPSMLAHALHNAVVLAWSS